MSILIFQTTSVAAMVIHCRIRINTSIMFSLFQSSFTFKIATVRLVSQIFLQGRLGEGFSGLHLGNYLFPVHTVCCAFLMFCKALHYAVRIPHSAALWKQKKVCLCFFSNHYTPSMPIWVYSSPKFPLFLFLFFITYQYIFSTHYNNILHQVLVICEVFEFCFPFCPVPFQMLYAIWHSICAFRNCPFLALQVSFKSHPSPQLLEWQSSYYISVHQQIILLKA